MCDMRSQDNCPQSESVQHEMWIVDGGQKMRDPVSTRSSSNLNPDRYNIVIVRDNNCWGTLAGDTATAYNILENRDKQATFHIKTSCKNVLLVL